MSVRILTGDVFDMLATLPDDHFDCVVTSPPYYGLRDYGTAQWEGGDPNCEHTSARRNDSTASKQSTHRGSSRDKIGNQCRLCGAQRTDRQIGLEPTLGEHIEVLVRLFRDVRRVMKPTATLWINYGDCYATTPNGRSAADTKAAGNDDRTFRDKPMSTIGGAIKAKDLCMIPNRLAIALQDDGWWVRSEIIWGKTNPMPDSSGAYRPSTSHEKIFMLTKSDDGDIWRARDTGELSFSPDLSERCPLITDPMREGARWIRLGSYYDAETVKRSRNSDEDSNEFPGSVRVGAEVAPRVRSSSGNKRVKMPDGWDTGSGGHGSHHRQGREKGQYVDKQRGHSRRHAGFNDRWDHLPKEEQQSNGRYLRNYESAELRVWPMATQAFAGAHFATFPPELVERCLMAGCPPNGAVLDPFGGAGTVALVADRMGIDATLIELSEAYVTIAKDRLTADAGMFAQVSS